MHTVLQAPQELSASLEGRFEQEDLQKYLSHSLTSVRPATATFLLWQGQCNTTIYLGQSDSLQNRRKMNSTSSFTSLVAQVSSAWELQMLKRPFELPSLAFFSAKSPCVPSHLEITLLLPSWHTTPFSRDVFPLEKRFLTSATTQGDCSLVSTLALVKTYGNYFFRLFWATQPNVSIAYIHTFNSEYGSLGLPQVLKLYT